jgi:creatinine amidohydrolase
MRTLLLPVGATEQHGPHLPLNTDSVIATSACAYASALTGVPVLPAIRIGVSIGHTEKWPGTFSVFHETLIDTVKEIARWCAATGWQRLVIVNSHLGNDAALRVAVDRIRFDLCGQLAIATRNTWALTAEINEAFLADATDWHANRAETDLMMFLAPGSVRTESLPGAADPDRTSGCVFPWMVANTSTNGATGAPGIGNSTHGERLLKLIGTSLALLLTRAEIETPPLPWKRTTPVFGGPGGC